MGVEKRPKSEFIKFVENELDILCKDVDDSEKLDDIKESVAILASAFETLANVGGGKSRVILRLFAKLAVWHPLTPLLGTDDEWEKIGEDYPEDTDILYQNKRCPHVYKRKNGTCFDAISKEFSYNGKVWFRNKDSNKDITFPYTVPLTPERIMLKEKP